MNYNCFQKKYSGISATRDREDTSPPLSVSRSATVGEVGGQLGPLCCCWQVISTLLLNCCWPAEINWWPAEVDLEGFWRSCLSSASANLTQVSSLLLWWRSSCWVTHIWKADSDQCLSFFFWWAWLVNSDWCYPKCNWTVISSVFCCPDLTWGFAFSCIWRQRCRYSVLTCFRQSDVVGKQ